MRQKVLSEWPAWRLVMSGFSYKTVFYEMLPGEIDEANVALDLQREADERAMNKKKV